MKNPLSLVVREIPPGVASMARVFAAWGAGLDGMGVNDYGARLSARSLPPPARTGQRPPGVPG